MEKLQTWAKACGFNSEFGPIIGEYQCKYFEGELCFELLNFILRKHRSVFQEHIKYIHDNILNPFRLSILQYSERVRQMYDIDKVLPPHPKKRGELDQKYQSVHNKQFTEDEIRVATKDALCISMKYIIDNKYKYYQPFPY